MLIPSSSSSNVKDSDLLGLLDTWIPLWLRAGNMLTVQLQDLLSCHLSRLWLRNRVCHHHGFVSRCYRLSIWFFSVIKWLMISSETERKLLHYWGFLHSSCPPTDMFILSDLWVCPLEEWNLIGRGTCTSRSCFWDFKGSKDMMFSCGPELCTLSLLKSHPSPHRWGLE